MLLLSDAQSHIPSRITTSRTMGTPSGSRNQTTIISRIIKSSKTVAVYGSNYPITTESPLTTSRIMRRVSL